MRMDRRLLFLVLSACAAAWYAPSARGDDVVQAPPDLAARVAFEAGLEAYEGGHFAEALAWFERANGQSPHPKLMFNIARAADGDAQYARAIEAYQAYLAAQPNADNREFVESRIDKLNSLRAPAPPVVDPPSPGPRVEQPRQVQLVAAPREHSDRANERPLWKRGWFWGVTGAVVAGAITTAVVLAVRDDSAAATPKVDETYMTLSWR
jgi:tetratricopeptide (TPR) repeat protein